MTPVTGIYTRELHIDAHRIGLHEKELLKRIGFCDDDFTAAGGGLERPAYHLSWEVTGTNAETNARRRRIFEETLSILSGTDAFSGYVESEVIPPNFQFPLVRKPFAPGLKLPLRRLDLVKTHRNKVADLHIKVPLDFLTAEAEMEFSRVGFYFVETPKRNRIYTLQFLSHKDGLCLFKSLREFFRRTGGATEITYEICDGFVRIPTELEAPLVVREGNTISENVARRI